MGLKATMGSSKFPTLPGGVYRAKIDAVTLNKKGQFGPAWIFNFTILSPQQHVGIKKTAIVSTELRPGWKLDKWIRAITGMQLQEGQEFDSDLCVGKVVDIMIIENRDEKGNIIGDKIQDIYPAGDVPTASVQKESVQSPQKESVQSPQKESVQSSQKESVQSSQNGDKKEDNKSDTPLQQINKKFNF